MGQMGLIWCEGEKEKPVNCGGLSWGKLWGCPGSLGGDSGCSQPHGEGALSVPRLMGGTQNHDEGHSKGPQAHEEGALSVQKPMVGPQTHKVRAL